MEVNKTEDKDVYFIFLKEVPTFPGGQTKLKKYISENIIYPKEAKDNKIKGGVFVKFIIYTDGSVTNVKVSKGIHPLLDKEAIRLVKAMPKWSPAKQHGKPIKMSYTVPVEFKL